MSKREHIPSRYRAIIKESRSGKGRSPEELIEDARALPDPYYVSLALFGLSADRRLKREAASSLVEEALGTVGKEGRPWRRAELLAAICKKARTRKGDVLDHQRLRNTILEKVLAFSEGKGMSDAIAGCLRYLGCERLLPVLSTAAVNKGFELETCKAVIRYWAQECQWSGPEPGELMTALGRVRDLAVRSRLYGYLHVQMARGGSEDMTVLTRAVENALRLSGSERVEALRYLASQASSLDELEIIAAGVTELDTPAGEARLLAALAGSADKAGHKDLALDWLISALDSAAEVDDADERARIRLNLAVGLQRRGRIQLAHGAFRAALDDCGGNDGLRVKIRKAMGEMPDAESKPMPETEFHAPRHILALYDTYEGGLKPIHIRMVARAAPLCVAYDLDLALMGFPVRDPDSLVKQVLADTNIGKGGRYLKELVKDGRVVFVKCTQRQPPDDWSRLGMPVATTSRPAKDKTTGLDEALEQARSLHPLKRLCLVMGLGKRGLPGSLLDAVSHHLELTGRSIPLETATAMGIIAQQLGRLTDQARFVDQGPPE